MALPSNHDQALTRFAAPRLRRAVSVLLLLGTLVIASRLPLTPRRLFSYDSVNLAYAMEEFDPSIGHPQPPFYPLFVVQMRLLAALGLDKPEAVMLVLKLGASIAALMAIVWAGEVIFAPGVGLCAAWLLLFHHSFWYGGLTSALRTQLALISLVVAGTCYPGWMGQPRWILASSVALGVGAGIRPETGALLFPLWLASLLRSGAGWAQICKAFGTLTAIGLLWLVPTVIASGGPSAWFSMSWMYLQDQSVLTSGLFGAATADWRAILIRLLVWTLSGALLWPLLASLAWRCNDGLGVGTAKALFLILWVAPSFFFAAFVHIADAGHSLAMVPVICIVGGWLLHRAAARLAPYFGREHALVVLLLPVLALNGLVFLGRFPQPVANPATRTQTLWLDLHDAMDLSSLWQVRRVARLDDRALDQVRRLAAECQGRAVVIWDGGDASFIKASYYMPELPVFAVAPESLQPGARVVASKYLGHGPGEVIAGEGPIEIPLRPGTRVLWMINPSTPRIGEIRKRFRLQGGSDAVFYHDLPMEDGYADVGGYVLTWRSTSD
jgi:hypothetical protein